MTDEQPEDPYAEIARLRAELDEAARHARALEEQILDYEGEVAHKNAEIAELTETGSLSKWASGGILRGWDPKIVPVGGAAAAGTSAHQQIDKMIAEHIIGKKVSIDIDMKNLDNANELMEIISGDTLSALPQTDNTSKRVFGGKMAQWQNDYNWTDMVP